MDIEIPQQTYCNEYIPVVTQYKGNHREGIIEVLKKLGFKTPTDNTTENNTKLEGKLNDVPMSIELIVGNNPSFFGREEDPTIYTTISYTDKTSINRPVIQKEINSYIRSIENLPNLKPIIKTH